VFIVSLGKEELVDGRGALLGLVCRLRGQLDGGLETAQAVSGRAVAGGLTGRLDGAVSE
jgi:hypothetical protein